MRIDKLTTKFQEALADAQSLAAGRDNQYIEPVHVLGGAARAAGRFRALADVAGGRPRAGAAGRAE
ncbi:Clp protease N-terminal domain-containing protein [Burkholderia multivorans]|uniref:Clp protease N-terminal domain-containing protein n=1 Tax=Burkholderia multivorans TaxID=87883 RepID=UPI003BAB8FB0